MKQWTISWACAALLLGACGTTGSGTATGSSGAAESTTSSPAGSMMEGGASTSSQSGSGLSAGSRTGQTATDKPNTAISTPETSPGQATNPSIEQ